MSERDYLSVEFVNYPLSAIRFQESLQITEEESNDVVGVLFALQLNGELSPLLISLSRLTLAMFDKDWIGNNIESIGGKIPFKQYIDTLYKKFESIMESKQGEFACNFNLTHNDTSSFVNPYIIDHLNYETIYRKNKAAKIQPKQYKVVRLFQSITNKELSDGLILMPFIKREDYSDDAYEVNFIRLKSKLLYTKRLCEEVCSYYTNLDQKQQAEYKDVYEHTKKVVEILDYLLDSGSEEALTLCNPLIRYVLPLDFTPQNIDGRLYIITVKLSMFFKKKSPDEVINDFVERREKKAGRLAGILDSRQMYVNKVNEATGGRFSELYGLMQNVYESREEEGRNRLLAKLRALFTDFLLYSSKSSFVETIVFKKDREKEHNSTVKEISEMKIHVGLIGNKFKVLTVADRSVKDAEFLTKKVLKDVLRDLREKVGFHIESIRNFLWQNFNIDTVIIKRIESELELLIPFAEELNESLKELKEKHQPYPSEISLKLLFSLVYFATLTYTLANKGYYIYIYSDRDDYPVLDHIRDLYYAGGLPVQIITKETADEIRSKWTINKPFPSSVNKNLFISSLKTLKRTSFVAKLSGLTKEDIEENETSYVVIEDRTEAIRDGSTHHIFTVYLVDHKFIQGFREIECCVETRLYKKYVSFCHIGDYIDNIIDDLLKKPRSKVFILRKSSIESIRFPSDRVVTATLLDPDAMFLKLVKKKDEVSKNKDEEDRGRISIIEEKDIEYMLEKIFEGEFPQKKYMFGISPSYVERLISKYKDSKERHSFHTDIKVVVVDDISEIDRKILLLDLLSIMHFEAEGFSEESSMAKIDLSFSKGSPTLELIRDGMKYKSKLNHMIVEILGLIGTGVINKERKKV